MTGWIAAKERHENPKIKALSPLARALFDYLMALHPKTVSGIFELRVDRVAKETAIPEVLVRPLIEELATVHERTEGSPLIRFDGAFAWIVGRWKHVPTKSPNHRAAIANEFLGRPTLPFWSEFFERYPDVSKHALSAAFKRAPDFFTTFQAAKNHPALGTISGYRAPAVPSCGQLLEALRDTLPEALRASFDTSLEDIGSKSSACLTSEGLQPQPLEALQGLPSEALRGICHEALPGTATEALQPFAAMNASDQLLSWGGGPPKTSPPPSSPPLSETCTRASARDYSGDPAARPGPATFADTAGTFAEDTPSGHVLDERMRWREISPTPIADWYASDPVAQSNDLEGIDLDSPPPAPSPASPILPSECLGSAGGGLLERIARIKNIFELRNWRKKHRAEIDASPLRPTIEAALSDLETRFDGPIPEIGYPGAQRPKDPLDNRDAPPDIGGDDLDAPPPVASDGPDARPGIVPPNPLHSWICVCDQCFGQPDRKESFAEYTDRKRSGSPPLTGDTIPEDGRARRERILERVAAVTIETNDTDRASLRMQLVSLNVSGLLSREDLENLLPLVHRPKPEGAAS